jgi:hypothetical protein
MSTVAGKAERARKDKPKTSVAPTSKRSDEDVRLLAYHLYERRCAAGTAGDAVGDWVRAEQLLKTAPASTNGN